MLVQLLLPGFHFQTLPQSSPSDRELTPSQMSQAGRQSTSSLRLGNWHTLATFWLPARLRSYLLCPFLCWFPHELELRPGGTHIITWPRDRAFLSHSPTGLMSPQPGCSLWISPKGTESKIWKQTFIQLQGLSSHWALLTDSKQPVHSKATRSQSESSCFTSPLVLNWLYFPRPGNNEVSVY